MGVDLLLVLVFAVMAGAVVIDRASARPAPAGPTPPVATAAPVAGGEPDLLQLPQLGAHAEGWALMGPSGTLVATNLPDRAALLAGACAMLRQAGDDAASSPWQTVSLQGPREFLLGEMSPRGAVLAVVARTGADRAALQAAMSDALAEVERRWDELLPAPPAPLPAPDPTPATALPSREGDEAGATSAFTPLD